MATPLRLMHGSCNLLRMVGRNFFSSSSKRYIVSEAYYCNEAWKKYLQDPNLNQVSSTDFARQLRDQLEKQGRASAVDMNVLSHQIHRMDEEEIDFMEDILARFNLCQDSLPRNDSTTHAIVRGFLASGHGVHLVHLLTDRFTFGIFPNHYALNLVIDSFIKQEDFDSAAKIAYSSMLQEDFSHPVNTLLSLYATVQHLLTSNIDDLAAPPKEASDGEEEWIKVKYIKFPYYDDHFDIKDERFLLGKTLLRLGDAQSVDLPSDLRHSLRIIGCGIYHKFQRGLAMLKDIANSSNGSISQQALDYFSKSLEKVEARDPNEPEVELALRTIDDVIHRMLPTTEEKDEFKAEFEKLKEELSSQNKIVTDFDLGQTVKEFVNANVAKFEESDITTQLALFDTWTEERTKELNKQIEEYKMNARIEEMKRQVKELQEQEEMLTYFDFEEKIRLAFTEEDRATDPNLTISK